MAKKSEGSVKQLIVKSYIKLCHQNSNNTVTLQMIANEAGVAFSTVRYYFAKDPLLLEKEAIDYTFKFAHNFFHKTSQEFRENEHHNPLIDYVEASFQFIDKHPEIFSYTMYFYYLLSTNAKFVKGNEDYLNIAIKRVESLIYESIGRGFYKKNSQITKKAKKIHTILYGNLLLTFTLASKKSEYSERLDHTKECIELILEQNEK